MKIPTPILEGPRIRLEPLTREHLPALEQIAFDDSVWRYMLQPMKTRDDLLRWLQTALRLEAAGTGMPWVTIVKDADRDRGEDWIVGSTRFIDLDLQHRTVEIGNTWLQPAFQGTGVNTEAKLLQLTYAFESLGLNRVAFKTHHENLRSQAAIQAMGAVYEGTFRNHYVMPDGSLRHSVWSSITREDWPQVRSRLEQRLRQAPRFRPSPPSA